MKCTICQRETPIKMMEKHHLTPKSRKGKETIKVCCNCGDQLHKLFTNKELEKNYNTLEAILSDKKVQRYVKWVKKKNNFHVPIATKKRR